MTEYQAALVKKYKCHPLPTLALPPLIHLPIFLTLSLTIRQAVTSHLPAASSPASDLLDPAALDPALAPTLPLDAPLVPFATESFAWVANLTDSDPTMALPFIIGLMAYGNIEMMQAFRASQSQALPDGEKSAPAPPASNLSAAAARPAKQKRARNLPPPLVRRQAIPGAPPGIVQSEDAAGNMTSAERAKRAAAKEQGSMRNRVVSNVLRLVAVASVGVAAQAPAVRGEARFRGGPS